MPSFAGAAAASAIQVDTGALRRARFCSSPAKLRPSPRTVGEVIACNQAMERMGWEGARDGALRTGASGWGQLVCTMLQRGGRHPPRSRLPAHDRTHWAIN